MLINICYMKCDMIYCNAGTTSVNQKGDLKCYDTEWYHSDEIKNTLSLKNLMKKCIVMYTCDLGNGFIV